jgi:putative membrane protein
MTMSVNDLPAVNATLNGLSAIFLGAGYALSRRKTCPPTALCMISAFITVLDVSGCYLTYHYFHGVTVFRNPPGSGRFT